MPCINSNPGGSSSNGNPTGGDCIKPCVYGLTRSGNNLRQCISRLQQAHRLHAAPRSRRGPAAAAQLMVATLMLVLAALPQAAVCRKPQAPPPPGAPPGVGGCATKKCPKPPPPSPTPPGPPPPAPPRRPNFVVIVTDDQDEVLNSTHPAYMPALNALLAARGTRFANTLASTSVCCPARVSLLTGRLAHCTNVTANWAPGGAWNKFASQRLDSDWLPGWLQAAGYRTVLLGKLLNGFSVPLAPKFRCPRGLDVLEALTVGTYDLYNSSFSTPGCGGEVAHPGSYQTDVMRDKALAYLDAAIDNSSAPFYLHITPAAPHMDNGGGEGWRPPPPAARHTELYPGLQLPPNPTLLKPNPLNPSRLLDMSVPANVQEMTELYVGRLRALRAVDEMVAAIVSKLEARGVFNNTYILYLSDNGLHFGQHGLDFGKATMLEEDSRVPLFISGPGVPAGVVSTYQANLVDVPATLRVLAGLPLRSDLDGLPLPLEGLTTAAYRTAMQRAAAAAAARAGLAPPPPPPKTQKSPPPTPALATPPPAPPPAMWFRESVILEAWDSDAKNGHFRNITFKALRLCSGLRPNFTTAQRQAGASRPPALMVPLTNSSAAAAPTYCLKYSVWCSGRGAQRELFDLSSDPFEAANVVSAAPPALLARLDAVLSVLVHCSGLDCVHPLGVLHPAGEVWSFVQAMDPRYDALYAALPRFAFESCYPLYVPPNERTFTLGLPGFPANISWAATGIVWPLPRGVPGLQMPGGDD